MIRFLHGADFHLDSAFGALPPGQAAARRRESRELALRLADYVKEHGIDLVLLAGDLFDSASPFRETGEQLAAALGQMRARVFISPGNHDWYGPGSPWETVDWPENVYVFKENRLTAVEVPERNLVIHGAAFSGPEQLESLLAGFTAPADGKCHIGLLHGELDGAEARYGPIRREEAAASGLCYLALGHVHKRTAPLTLGRTVCAWPGCPEGRGFDELGEKGFYEGTISDGGEVSLTFVPFARHRYEVLEVDVTGKEPRAAVEAALPPETAGDLYRILLTGETGEGGAGPPGSGVSGGADEMNEMKKILLIGTGGTIASDVTDSGLAPELTTEQLLSHIPGISDICGVDCLQLLNLDSTNMTPAHWLEIAACIRDHYGCYDGFVITHGTDTMAYTAAALSYLIQGSPKPIVLTGAQRPIGFDSTDSKTNLADAFRCAAEDLPGVSIVFNSRVILGTRAKKTRSKSFQAFSSINHPELGVLRDGVLLRYIRQDCREAPVFYDRLDPRVALLKLVPGTGRDAADFLLERNDALIIESFGVGGLPEAGGFYDCVRRWMEAGRVVVLTTQVENEGSDLGVYHVGYRLKSDLGVLEAYDMTTEAVVAKLMWILGQTRRREEVERLFYTPVARDILWPGL